MLLENPKDRADIIISSANLEYEIIKINYGKDRN
jgi:hypothetical protein